MSQQPISRGKAKAALAALSRGKRDSIECSLPELYPYGMYASEPRNSAYDRDVVISATAVLEQTLEEAILAKFTMQPDADEMLFLDETRLVRDFYDKARMAYLLGIIGKLTLHDLSIIRYVRNAFAHSRGHLDLDMTEFTDLLCHLTTPTRWPEFMAGHSNQDERERFIQTCFQLSMYLAIGHEKEETAAGRIMRDRIHVFRQ